MRTVDLIGHKRAGGEHAPAEIDSLVSGYVGGTLPDYQMAAWLMAVVWHGLTDAETFALTGAMVASGDVLDLSALPGVPVDKHSTGGVGDKTTLAVVPILAAAGVPVAKMSGRGLGHTGGTLDKLDSIPGLRTQLTLGEIMAQVQSVGACVVAQTETLVPADRKLYALRDATSTVENVSLIAASIMSKKIAGGSRAVVLDVKVGGGAFMKTLADARQLAQLMIAIGAAHGQKVCAVLTDMDTPLGFAVGNRLEVREVVSLLKGDADPRLLSIVLTLSGAGFVLAGLSDTLDAGRELAQAQITSGAALSKLRELVSAQGGDPAFLDTPNPAPLLEVRTARSGFVTRINALAIGEAAMRVGAGRATKDDAIDPDAGVVLRVTVGQRVQAGDVLAHVWARDGDTARAVHHDLLSAVTVEDAPPPDAPLVLETLGL